MNTYIVNETIPDSVILIGSAGITTDQKETGYLRISYSFRRQLQVSRFALH